MWALHLLPCVVGLAFGAPGELRFSRAAPQPVDLPEPPEDLAPALAEREPSRVFDLPALDPTASALVWALLHDPAATGRAYTLVLPEASGTLRVELGADRVRVVRSDARPATPERAPDDLEAAMGGARLRGRWAPEERDVLWTAWSLLDERERALVGPLVAKRRRSAGKGVRASLRQNMDVSVLVVSDALFEPATGVELSVGPADAPARFDVSVLVHELGHAVDFGPSRLAWAAWMRGGPQARNARNCATTLAQGGHQATALLEVDPSGGPSEYGAAMLAAGRPEEDFAERFMLLKLDPSFLEQQDSDGLAWFRTGAHTAWVDRADGPWERCAAK